MINNLRNNTLLVWEYRELLWNLAHREITQRYKQSILGYGWVVLNPLFQMVVVSFVFSVILKISSLGVPFIIFLSIALLPWNFFVNSLTSSTNVLVSNSSLITKIYFPREILIYATIIAKIVDFLFSCIVLIFFFIYYGTLIQSSIVWVPLIFFIQLLFMTGLSLIVATLNLFYRDIQYLLALILTLWMYLTPIMYPVEIIPQQYRLIFSLNPMAVIVNAYRKVILSGGPPNFSSLAIAFVVSLCIFILGFYIFKKSEGKFADFV